MTMLAQQEVSSLPSIKRLIDDNPQLKLVQVAAQSTRLHILYLLLSQRMYPTQLEKQLRIPRRVISFHLDALENAKLVESKFGLSGDSRPQAVRYYSITPKGKDILQMLLDMLKK
jgi:DNA-binding HxlR family transcriptional regulator